ncbi:MAG: nitronate monooxygenase [Thermodesulfovibrionales bacterium]|nr:nitronate monooxygenase [Thermodesulfovibrionales bacterium]
MNYTNSLPKIIQGGMGIGVSSWRLAKVVSQHNQMGVVSGTAIDSVVARRLQLGDPDGSIRRALEHFPFPQMVENILNRYYIPGGKAPNEPFKLIPIHSVNMHRLSVELAIIANFVEVYLSKEGHDGIVGINYLEKIQLPTLPSIFGAMLAGIDYILMGAGIPLLIPGIIDKLSALKPVELRLSVEDNPSNENFYTYFNPKQYCDSKIKELKRPKFLAIVSSDIVAKTLVKKASGIVDGFIVEGYIAGGHNAPPRRTEKASSTNIQKFSERDIPNIPKIAELNRPFWLAGGYASPQKLKEALSQGASGIQVGTAFAFCKESSIVPSIKQKIINKCLDGSLDVYTDFKASPTGYPFKMVRLEGTMTDPKMQQIRKRICDLGYLRRLYFIKTSEVGYRCPAEPVDHYLRKGGTIEETLEKQCLCNGLMATIGLGQVRDYGIEPPIITSGEDYSPIINIVKQAGEDYSAKDVIEYLSS